MECLGQPVSFLLGYQVIHIKWRYEYSLENSYETVSILLASKYLLDDCYCFEAYLGHSI